MILKRPWSKSAGCSGKRTLQPRQTDDERAEPVMSRRRPRPAGLANIYPHVLDTGFIRRGVGEVVRYADDGVVLCRSAAHTRDGPYQTRT